MKQFFFCTLTVLILSSEARLRHNLSFIVILNYEIVRKLYENSTKIVRKFNERNKMSRYSILNGQQKNNFSWGCNGDVEMKFT